VIKAARFEASNHSMAANHNNKKIMKLKMMEMTIHSGKQSRRRVGRLGHGRLVVNSSLLLLGPPGNEWAVRY